VVVSDGGAIKTIIAPSVGYLALTMKSYGNVETSHGLIQCIPTDLKGKVASLYSCF
jgi:hypothetical protein